uniref:Uncharacterized protein n=1 Tax=Glossina pallidipes TaxID=7398 RepID=A0A1B0A6U9_GLOPL
MALNQLHHEANNFEAWEVVLSKTSPAWLTWTSGRKNFKSILLAEPCIHLNSRTREVTSANFPALANETVWLFLFGFCGLLTTAILLNKPVRHPKIGSKGDCGIYARFDI